ncbi:MAG: hypothetical protein NVSMB33_14820 [Ktedonobacteraceae bacterium]
MGDSANSAEDGWGQPFQGSNAAAASSASNWSAASDQNAMTLADASVEPPTVRSGSEAPTVMPASTAQATLERPAKFILRADNGDVLQEYQLEKSEISIGRAPNSDILLSKDKLTSRRHATVRQENGNYVLYDERSANGTFVNGQQLEEMTPRVLQEGDHVGIGEHELIFYSASSASSAANEDASGVADLPTIAVPYNVPQEVTSAPSDDFSTRSMENGTAAASSSVSQMEEIPSTPPLVMSPPSMSSTSTPTEAASMPSSADDASANVPLAYTSINEQSAAGAPSMFSSSNGQSAPTFSPLPAGPGTGISFNRLTTISQPSLPDIAPLLAALSALDGQVMSLQEQLNATQEAVRNHDTEVAQMANQIRVGVRNVSDRMDSTIADVARSREALAWTDLLQLMEDVQNNPRDIEYVSKLGRKARELNKVFQIHQSVLNTLAECNSLLRSLVGEDK